MFFVTEKQGTNHLFSWGFTLVEILAVIVILAIILLIAVPTIIGITESAKQEAFKDSTLSIFKAVEMKAVNEGKYAGQVSELELSNHKFLTGEWIYNKNDNTIVLTQVCDGNYKVDVVVSNNTNMVLKKDDGTCGFEIAIVGNNPDTVNCHASNKYEDKGANYGNNKIISLDQVDLRYAGTYTLNYLYGSFKASRLVNVTNDNMPVINLKNHSVTINQWSTFTASDYLISATDECEGDITDKVIAESNVITTNAGTYTVTYKVKNRSGQEKEEVLNVTVVAATYKEKILNGADPEIYDGLIPVVYNGSAWVVADKNNIWYQYSTKSWANAITLRSDGTRDYSGNNYHGTLHNGLKIERDENGINALTFDGVDDYFQVPSLPSSINWRDGYTIEFTATWEALNSWSRIIDFGIKGNNNNILIANSATTNSLVMSNREGINAGDVYYENAITLNTKATYKIEVVKKANNNYEYKLYKNGILGKTESVAISINNVDRILNYIGKSHWDNDGYFKGKIYDLKISLSNSTKVLEYDFTKFSSKYEKATARTTIPMDSIATMLVWIPRYEYTIKSEDGINYYGAGSTSNVDPGIVDINFVNKTTAKVNGSGKYTGDLVENYYTHPAFAFGSTELNGFWISKFELTGTINNITSKPNQAALTSYNIATFFTNILDIKNRSIYGLNSSQIDTHMIKNLEWGALALLSQSKRGKASYIFSNNINSSLTYYAGAITGCSGNDKADAMIRKDSCVNSYNTTKGYQASTTGNVTGVYDTSGGSWEYVMAHYDGYIGNQNYNGGFNGLYADDTPKTDGVSLPPSKYIDKYSGTAIKGDATTLDFTGKWYNMPNAMPTKKWTWLGRGGHYEEASNIFTSYAIGSVGSAHVYLSTRLIISK